MANYSQLVSDKGREATTADIVDSGLVTIIGSNNHYYINAYYNTTYKKISSYGGANSIGIEMAVNTGSDLNLTMSYTAKFTASLLNKYNLTLDRVVTHNNLSGKDCPMTLRNNGMMDYFYSMIEIEYMIKKYYSDYTIKFESLSPTILSNTGIIINRPQINTNVQYRITVSKGSYSKSMVFNTLIEGTKK